MKKNSNNNLIEDLIITGNHPILIDTFITNEFIRQSNYFIENINGKYLLLSYISNNFKCIKNNNIYNYYNFILESDDTNNTKFGVYANGLLVEILSDKLLIK
jgi:hypothetical protein